MTVAELIKALSDFPPDMDVNYSDVDYGYVGIAKAEIRDVPGVSLRRSPNSDRGVTAMILCLPYK